MPEPRPPASPARASMVDAYAQVFVRLSPRYPRPVSEVHPPGREARAEQLLTAMDGAGVGQAVVAALSTEDEYLRECLAAHSDRLVGLSTLDLRHPSARADLARKAGTPGVRGIRVHWLGMPDADPEETPAYEPLGDLAEAGLVMWFFGPRGQLPLLDRLLSRLAGLTVVLGHLGLPLTPLRPGRHGTPRPIRPPASTLDEVLALARHPGCHVALCGQASFSQEPYPYRDLDPLVRALYRAYGAERLLWGSDAPWSLSDPGYERALELPDCQLPGLSAEERQAILGGNARRLFRL
ncbi:MAG TPA: amidohydrolase family protein [Candidatus Dormibacteraeota bacterium]|nr:amidohydrolase family protein [Candidatus Dormibacteraeota bacterium]